MPGGDAGIQLPLVAGDVLELARCGRSIARGLVLQRVKAGDGLSRLRRRRGILREAEAPEPCR